MTLPRALGMLCVVLGYVGCASVPPPPRLAQPATYHLNFPIASAAMEGGGAVEFTQGVTVPPRELLYYRVDSPSEVTVSVYEADPVQGRTLLGQMRGSRFTTSVMPSRSQVEFHFSTMPPAPEIPVRFFVANAPIPIATAETLAVAAE